MDKKNLRIIFMGTPEFAVTSLKLLVNEGYNVVAVVTQPDKPVGRHQDRLQPSMVKQYALSQGIPVLQPVKMKDPDFLKQLAACQAHLQVVVAFRMLPQEVWSMPSLGTFNVHAALLPQYRGAAPINWAIINGETETGVTTFFLDQHIDTGRVILQKHFAIPDDANVEYVYNGLMHLGADIARETIDLILATDGHPESMSQDEIPADALLPAPKIFKETCQINWQQPARKVYDFIRGLSPIPAAWTNLVSCDTQATQTARVVKIYATRKTGQPTDAPAGTISTAHGNLLVATADEWLHICQLQLAGKKRMADKDFLNGARDLESLCMRHID